MEQINSLFFIKTLKKLLKSSKTTYRELAERLQMSEAGVKKIFLKNDVSFGRALQICNIMGIDITEVIRDSNEEIFKEKKLTETQQKFFLENPSYFHFFMQLAYEQNSIDTIKKQCGLSEKSIFKYLKRLDDIGLIKLQKNNTFNLIDGAVIRLRTSGTIMEKLKFQATEDFLKIVQQSKTGFLGGGVFYLSNSEIENLQSDFSDVHDKYLKKSQFNRARRKKNSELPDHKVFTIMFMHAPQTLFGKIKDLEK